MNLRYPPNILEKHRTALEHVANDIERELGPALLSIVVGGSVAAGKALPHSDVDVCIIANIEWYQRRRLRINDTEVDIFIDSPARVHQQIEGGNQVFFRMHGLGWILYDTSSTAVHAKRASEVMLKTRRRAIEPGFAFTLRNRAKDILSDFHRAVGVDDNSAKYLLAIFVPWCISSTFRFRREWPGPEKRDLQELAKFAPDVHELVIQLLSEKLPMSERGAIADRLADAIFGSEFHKTVDIGPKGGLAANTANPMPFRVGFDGKNLVVHRS